MSNTYQTPGQVVKRDKWQLCWEFSCLQCSVLGVGWCVILGLSGHVFKHMLWGHPLLHGPGRTLTEERIATRMMNSQAQAGHTLTWATVFLQGTPSVQPNWVTHATRGYPEATEVTQRPPEIAASMVLTVPKPSAAGK